MSKNVSGKTPTAANANNQQLDLPFDQYQRYKIVADALELLKDGSEPLQILDVGGAEGIILNFLTEDEVTILDQAEAEGVPNFVVGDATALQFEDESFDYAVSVDVYEHIGDEAREKYLSELRRVARRGVLLAAPFDSEVVRGAERLANEFHRSVHLQENMWLVEHAENGLPNLSQSREYFEEYGDQVAILPNGYLPHWLAMISFTFYSPHLRGEMQGMGERLNKFYNEFIYRYDNAEPSYRYLLIALKEDKEVDFEQLTSSAERPNAAMSTALFSTFSSTLSLAPQLKDLSRQLAKKDSQLAKKDSQLAKKEAQISDLSRRLAQQTVTANKIATMKQENTSLKQQRNQLKRQLDAIANSRAWKLVEKQRNLRTSLKSRLGSRLRKLGE